MRLGSLFIILGLLVGSSYGPQIIGKRQPGGWGGDAAKIPPKAQFVLFSFDGSRTLPVIQYALDFASDMRARGKPLHFTFYVNAAHFLNDEAAARLGVRTQVYYGGTPDMVEKRIALFKRALSEGHEMASHAVGHDDGSYWSEARWAEEFDRFAGIMRQAEALNTDGRAPAIYRDEQDGRARPESRPAQTFAPSTFAGFRAPELGMSAELYPALAKAGFRYDSSGVGLPDVWPQKNAYGTWLIPLPTLSFGPARQPVLSMDYSIWMHQSGARDVAKRGDELWSAYFHETMDAYRRYFRSNYEGNRAPVMIANHLYTDWNDEVYWEALKELAEEVCGLPDVACASYRELVDHMDKKG